MTRAAIGFLLMSFIAAGAWASTTIATEIATVATPADRCKAFMTANPDLVCLPLAAARALDVKLATLDHDLQVAKLKARHLGLTLGCGLGVSAFITDSWSTKALPAATCAAIWGWRF